MKSLIIVNPADCIGCRTCEVACVVAHPSEQELNADVFLPRLKVQRLDSISAPVMCHQCENAPCVGACPVGALTMGEQVVQTNSARCIGCQSCVSACPFGMITIQSLPGDTRQQIVKCDLCEQREEGYQGYKTLFEYLIKGIPPKGEAISVPISIILQNNIKFYEEFI